MALDVGTLVAYLKLDTSDVGKNLRKMQDDIRRSMGDMDKTTEAGTSRVTNNFATMAKRTAGLLAGAFAVEKVVDFFRSSIDAAGEANAAVQRSSIVFGANSKTIETWAKGAARNFGISEQAAVSSAASFGDMFSQIGFTSGKAVDMSKSVVQLAADLGAFKGLRTEDVLERISAGFRGEYDSLQLLVPSISAAAVEQQALTDTGKKSADSLTAQEKAAATLAVVMKGAGNATGFYAKHAQDKAQVEKSAAAATEELVAKVGQRLLPAYTALVSFGRDQVIPFLSGTVDVIGQAGSAIGPLVVGVGAIASGFRDLPGPLQGAVVGMLAFILLKDRLATFGTTVQTSLKTAGSTIQSFGEAMHYAGLASERAGGGIAGFAAGARTFTGSAGLMKGAASGLLGVLGGPWGAAFTGATALVGVWMQKQADAKRSVQELTDAIRADSGALGENTAKRLVNQLETEGVLKAARDMGISVADVTAAITGNTDALARVNDGLSTFTAAQSAAMSGAQDYSAAMVGVTAQTDIVTNAITGKSDAITQSKDALNREGDALTGVAPKLDAYGNSTQSAGDKTSTTTTKVETLAGALARLSGDTLDAREATRQYEAAVDTMAEALAQADEEHVKTADRMNVSTETGRRLQAALDSVAETTLRSAKADLTRGDSLTVVTQRVESARAAFIANAQQMGYSEAAASALADQLGLTTQNVQALSSDIAKVPPVKLAINQAAFNASLAEVRSQLNSLSGVAIVTARLQATQLRNELRQMQMDGQADGSIMQFANGGFRGANIMQFAGGGFRGAGIYSDGADIVRFAERGTGGEAYIPLASSKRARSTKILAETNRLMGNPLGAAGASLSEIRDAVEAGVSSALAQGIMGEFRGDFGNVDRITGSVVADLKVALRRA